MISNTTKYNSGFSVGGMYLHEFQAIENIVKNDDFESLIKTEGANNKYLAIKTEQSRKRVISEIIRMHKKAPEGFWDAFYSWGEQEQKLGIFFLRLKTYELMFDLHFEVTVKNYRVGSDLTAYGLTMRLDELTSINQSIASWSEALMTKLNSKYRSILADVGLCKAGKLSPSTVDNPMFWSFFEQCNEAWFLEACFIK